MKSPKIINLYSKFCVKCIWPEKLMELERYASDKGTVVKFKRTVYSRDWQAEARRKYGSDEYHTFIEEDGKIEDFEGWRAEVKKKPARKSKKKGVKNA